MQIGKNSVVSLEYTLTDPQGGVIDTTNGRGPLVYMHGTGALIPGLEAELDGKSAGDELKVTLAPEVGYGQRDPSLIQKVPRSSFPKKTIEVGQQFRTQSGGQTRTLTITGFEGDDVKIDANHPLAGMTLHFDVKVVEVRAATEEEVAHGHVHGAGGHHH